MSKPVVLSFSAKAGCVDCDTEFFTGTEWKKISEYQEGDMVLQYNADGTANLVKPLEYIHNKNDNFYHFENKSLDMLLTENHNVVYYTNRNNLQTKKWVDVILNHKNSKNGFSGKIKNSFIYCKKGNILDIDYIRLKIAISADGSKNYQKDNDYIHFNLKKERKINRLTELLKKLKIEYNHHIYDTGFHKIAFYFKDFDKSLKWIYELDSSLYNEISKEIVFWDGYENKNNGSYNYFSTLKENADLVQFVWSSLNFRTSILLDERVGKNTCYNVHRRIEPNKFSSMTRSGYTNAKKEIKSYRNYGDSYCFTVDSGMLVLRRNNKIFITGNSGKDTCVEFALECFKRQNKKAIRIAYGDYVKFVCKQYYNWDGEKDEYGRSLLQKVGSDARITNPNIWVDMAISIVNAFFADYDYVLISDCRFENEMSRWKEKGFDILTFRINRPNFDNGMTEEQKNHISEVGLDNYKFDYYIENIYDNLDDFRSSFKQTLFESLKEYYENKLMEKSLDELSYQSSLGLSANGCLTYELSNIIADLYKTIT